MRTLPPSIGNDIVDLMVDEPPLHPRFAARVLSRFEAQRVGSDRMSLWLHWAAKEAAYKALKRIVPELNFVPKELIYDPARKCIRLNNVVLPCRAIVRDDCIFVVCATSYELLEKRSYSWFQPVDAQDLREPFRSGTREVVSPSIAVRVAARERLSRLLRVHPNELVISGGSDDIHAAAPLVTIRKGRGPVRSLPLSITHHGLFFGFSLACCEAHTVNRISPFPEPERRRSVFNQDRHF